MKLHPPKGMRDTLITETRLRSIVLDTILSHYRNAGFFQISTPALEDIDNIAGSDGGDNLNLVFNIMKRGESLAQALSTSSSLADMALRYDLTLPLCRAYADNKDSLPYPFKVIQTGLVYRAEKPQKGRLREFRQCDIDIIGDKSINAEIELIATSLGVLSALGFENLTLRVNDRRILYALLASFGFDEKSLRSVCITFDKLDKIGISGVESELLDKGFAKKSISALVDFIKTLSDTKDPVFLVSSILKSGEYIDELKFLISALSRLIAKDYKVIFSPQLVRGQGYYTGPVAEVYSEQFDSAIAAGGRYDNMIGKFTGVQTPAVGFSIGFERIISILLSSKSLSMDKSQRIALVYSQDADFVAVMEKKRELMKNADVTVFSEQKNKKKFYSQLSDLNFDKVVDALSGAEKLLTKGE